MVYGLPTKQLEERAEDFIKKSEDENPNSGLYLADALYHRACILGQTHNIDLEHPEIKRAQSTYINALAMEADGVDIDEIYEQIVDAAAIIYELATGAKELTWEQVFP